jgi:hypothetical protein
MALVALVALMALVALVALVTVMALMAMVAFVAATRRAAATWCNAILKTFHFETSRDHDTSPVLN